MFTELHNNQIWNKYGLQLLCTQCIYLEDGVNANKSTIPSTYMLLCLALFEILFEQLTVIQLGTRKKADREVLGFLWVFFFFFG